MQDNLLVIFVVLVFATVFLMSQLIIIPTMGTAARESKKIKKRLTEIARDRPGGTVSLVRAKYLKKLSPFERWMDSLPGMQDLNVFIEQSGRLFPGYRLVLASVVLGIFAGMVAWIFLLNAPATVIIGLLAACLPFLKLRRDRNTRLEKFEAQLPEALDIMSRALKSGNPFNVSLSYASREMESPLSDEFGIVFDEINYGRDLPEAFHYLLLRVPSVSLMAMITAILIQRETGGNLSELLDNIAQLLRQRFRFQREVRVLTAEGRMSAWILSLMPFGIFALISWMNPKYYEQMISSPLGMKVLGIGIALIVIGIIWISRMVRIEV